MNKSSPALNVEASPVPVCTLEVDRIISLLHIHAEEKASDKVAGIVIENTAASGDNESSAVFHGPGEHLVSVRLEKEDAKILQTDAIKAIREYIKWFVGPDVEKELKDEDIRPIDDDDEQVKEALISGGFGKYLDNLKMLSEAESEDGDNPAEDQDDDTAPESDDGDEVVDGEDDDEAADASDDDKAEEQQDDKKPSASAYVLPYKIHIEGMNSSERKIGDALKNFAAGIFHNIGIRFMSGWGDDGSGNVVSVKDIYDQFGNLFGNVDLNTFVPAYTENLKRKFREATEYNAQVEVWDQNVIKKWCRTWLSGKDLKKINAAQYCVTTRFNKNDKAPELFTPKVIANTMNETIGSIFKKRKHGIKPDDIIFIRNYSDSVRDRMDRRYNRNTDYDENTPDVNESIAENLQNFIKDELQYPELISMPAQETINDRLFSRMFSESDDGYRTMLEAGDGDTVEEENEELDKVVEFLFGKIGKADAKYADELEKKLSDKEFEKIALTVQTPFTVNGTKYTSKQKFGKKDFIDLLKKLTGESKDTIETAVEGFNIDKVQKLLSIKKTDSHSVSKGGSSSFVGMWFMYIVPMPGAEFKNEDTPNLEGVDTK